MINNSVTNPSGDAQKKPNEVTNTQGPSKTMDSYLFGHLDVAIAYLLILQAAKISAHTTVIHSKQLDSNGLHQMLLDNELEGVHDTIVPPNIVNHHRHKEKGDEWKHFHAGSSGIPFEGHGGDPLKGSVLYAKSPATEKTTPEQDDAAVKAKPTAQKKPKIHTQQANFWHDVTHAGKDVGHAGGKIWHAMGGPTVTPGKQKYYYTTKRPNKSAILAAQAENLAANALRQTLTQRITLEQQSAQVGETEVDMSANSIAKKMQEDSAILQLLQSLTYKALLRQQPQ